MWVSAYVNGKQTLINTDRVEQVSVGYLGDQWIVVLTPIDSEQNPWTISCKSEPDARQVFNMIEELLDALFIEPTPTP